MNETAMINQLSFILGIKDSLSWDELLTEVVQRAPKGIKPIVPKNPMDKGLIFSLVSKHLLQQKVKSQDYGGRGLYFCGELRCALGCLIPDDLYSSELEILGGIANNDQVEAILTNIYGKLDLSFLQELQNIHDVHDPYLWKEKLESFASRHNLK